MEESPAPTVETTGTEGAVACQAPSPVTRTPPRGPQGRQDGADPEPDEDLRGLGHRAEVAGDGGVLQVRRAPAGQLGELLPVGLD